jgi:hypothetical protein
MVATRRVRYDRGMTFIINNKGAIYQKDRSRTPAPAREIDPNPSGKRVDQAS